MYLVGVSQFYLYFPTDITILQYLHIDSFMPVNVYQVVELSSYRKKRYRIPQDFLLFS